VLSPARLFLATAASAAFALSPATALADGPFDVSGISFGSGSFFDVATGLPGPVGVHAIATVGAPSWQYYDEMLIEVRPAGGEWDPSLRFPHSPRPVGVGGYSTVMLSTTRSFAPGAYEARVSARQGATWVHDEVVAPFTLP
jgi:hypothetical protein